MQALIHPGDHRLRACLVSCAHFAAEYPQQVARSTPNTEPTPRAATVRQAIREVLRDETLSAVEISERVGVREREVAEHLEHLRRSLARRGEQLVVEPARCVSCGFRFRKRERLSRPGRCPQCGGGRIESPRFALGRR